MFPTFNHHLLLPLLDLLPETAEEGTPDVDEQLSVK
jgi:hypothetical protein